MENEDQERNAFFNVLNEQFEYDEESVKSGLELLERIVNRKLIKPYYYGFRSITQEEANERKKYEQKNKITSFVHLLLLKLKENKESAFRTLLKDFGLSTISEHHDTSLKLKGKVLFGLK